MTKKLHGKEKLIKKFCNDNFEFDFEKNQAICPEGHRMDFKRKLITNRKTGNWTNMYQTKKCLNCEFKSECIGLKSRKRFRDAEINPLMRTIRLRFNTKEGLEKYNKRFHKGEIAQTHILHNLGYREFKTRLKQNCENELNLVCLAYNLKKIYIKLKKKGNNIKLLMKNSINAIDLNSLFHFYIKNVFLM